jgi:hypothetical protein
MQDRPLGARDLFLFPLSHQPIHPLKELNNRLADHFFPWFLARFFAMHRGKARHDTKE